MRRVMTCIVLAFSLTACSSDSETTSPAPTLDQGSGTGEADMSWTPNDGGTDTTSPTAPDVGSNRPDDGADGSAGEMDSGSSEIDATMPSDSADSGTNTPKTLLELMNEKRASGITCAGINHPSVAPLRIDNELSPLLEGAAQVHAQAMEDEGLTDHYGTNGTGFIDRMAFQKRLQQYDFGWHYLVESLATDVSSPEEVIAQWLESDRYCSAMMNPNVEAFGMGRAGDHWVVLTGTGYETSELVGIQPDAPWKRNMLEALNDKRAEGADCGGNTFSSIDPAQYSIHLEGAAMVHAMDMHYNGVTGERGSDNSSIGDRLQVMAPDADIFPRFGARNQAEVTGPTTVDAVFDAWMSDSDDCLGIMVQDDKWVGLARYRDSWVAVFGGAPKR